MVLSKMIMANVDDPQYKKDLDAAYLTLSQAMWKTIGVYGAEPDLRRAMQIYNEGAALAWGNFREALSRAKDARDARARGGTEALW